ncbi:hypothetical protein AM593_07053, partial [Mytilus galloprovincialis]
MPRLHRATLSATLFFKMTLTINDLGSKLHTKDTVISDGPMASQAAEETNFIRHVRLSYLLLKIAPLTVREYFDKEFHPDELSRFLFRNMYKLRELYDNKIISLPQWLLLFPKKDNVVSSGSFDIQTMCLLLRNFTEMQIPTTLPHPADNKVGSD